MHHETTIFVLSNISHCCTRFPSPRYMLSSMLITAHKSLHSYPEHERSFLCVLISSAVSNSFLRSATNTHTREPFLRELTRSWSCSPCPCCTRTDCGHLRRRHRHHHRGCYCSGCWSGADGGAAKTASGTGFGGPPRASTASVTHPSGSDSWRSLFLGERRIFVFCSEWNFPPPSLTALLTASQGRRQWLQRQRFLRSEMRMSLSLLFCWFSVPSLCMIVLFTMFIPLKCFFSLLFIFHLASRGSFFAIWGV